MAAAPSPVTETAAVRGPAAAVATPARGAAAGLALAVPVQLAAEFRVPTRVAAAVFGLAVAPLVAPEPLVAARFAHAPDVRAGVPLLDSARQFAAGLDGDVDGVDQVDESRLDTLPQLGEEGGTLLQRVHQHVLERAQELAQVEVDVNHDAEHLDLQREARPLAARGDAREVWHVRLEVVEAEEAKQAVGSCPNTTRPGRCCGVRSSGGSAISRSVSSSMASGAGGASGRGATSARPLG